MNMNTITIIGVIFGILGTIVTLVYGYPTTIWILQPGKQQIVCPDPLIEYSTSGVGLKNEGKIVGSTISVKFDSSNEGILFKDDYGNIKNNISIEFYTPPGKYSQFKFIPVVNKSHRGNATLYINARSDFNSGPLHPRNSRLYKECNYSKSASNSFKLESEYP